MRTIAEPNRVDPLAAFAAGAFAKQGRRPMPLVSTSFDVDIDAGLAIVSTKRVFRNDESQSIEATMTFPVPVHAVLFALEARVDGRTVKARAQARAAARETYEDAIERGKAAVLHEEVLRGVHMLSLAHIAPGAEIEVTAIWACALSYVAGRGRLRIPLTVGDIYGRSGLSDADDLLTGGPVQSAELTVRCTGGDVQLRGGDLVEGRARVKLDRPIDLEVAQETGAKLHGLAADGREVVLRIAPQPDAAAALNVALVVDRSGSMASGASAQGAPISKHQAIVEGLKSIAQHMGDADAVDLWEFDDTLSHVGASGDDDASAHGASRRKRFLDCIARLNAPGGGTEIGVALAGTIAASRARDILLVTDGKSYALDVHVLARMGRRITVVLVGEDSLEANVGHLAALSGGDIFVAAGTDIADTLSAAIASLRTASERPHAFEATLDHVRLTRAGAVLEAQWRPAAASLEASVKARAVAAMAASLALPALDETRAATLAEGEGLVTHLTSLVLVDEAGEAQDGIPAQRKIALPQPATNGRAKPAYRARMGLQTIPADDRVRRMPTFKRHQSLRGFVEDRGDARRAPPAPAPVPKFGMGIDWDHAPNSLLAGDLSDLDPPVARMIEEAAAHAKVVALAQRMNIAPVVLVIALVAQSQASRSRSAARIAKQILAAKFAKDIRALASLLGLD
jgi:Vault protein inter-alpha-trypsin domain/von Willebrand factor type A domain